MAVFMIISLTLLLLRLVKPEGIAPSVPTYNVPSFHMQDLTLGLQDEELKQVLTSTGLFTIRIPFHRNSHQETSSVQKNNLLEGLCQCRDHIANVRGGDVTLLSDGRTVRSSLATASLGMHRPLSLPEQDIHQQCYDKDGSMTSKLEIARDYVSRAVTSAFVPALDRILIHQRRLQEDKQRMEGFQKNHHSFTPLLPIAGGSAYSSISSILNDSVHLEHFHIYSQRLLDDAKVSNKASSSNSMNDAFNSEVVDMALDFHTDAGLFLAFLPASSCSDKASLGQKYDDDSFRIQVPTWDKKGFVEMKAVFSNDSKASQFRESNEADGEITVAIMLGAGAQHWLNTPTNLELKATVHAVKMKPGDERAWYGMMYLVPPKAIIQTIPYERTFADMKEQMATTHSANRKFGDSFESRHIEQSDVSIGCGNYQSQNDGFIDSVRGEIDSRSISSTFRHNHRRRLQMVDGPGDCSNSTNFYCWMSCLHLPDNAKSIQDDSVQTNLKNGQSLYCLDESVLVSSDLIHAVNSCRDPKSGAPGGAMRESCAPYWHSTVAGVDALLPSTSSDTPNDVITEKYCYGGTTMYMSGFEWEGSTCVIYLFHGWTLSSRSLLALACVGTVFFGFLTETILWKRRTFIAFLCKKEGSAWKTVLMNALLYGVQLVAGYFLMLIVMTYSAPLTLSVVLGLVISHAYFCWHESVTGGKDLTPSIILDGATPCCQNKVTSIDF